MHTKSNLYAYKFEFECIQQNTLYEQVTKIRSNNRANSSTKPLFSPLHAPAKVQNNGVSERELPKRVQGSIHPQKYRTTGRRKENYRRVCRAPYTCKGAEQQPYNSKTPTTSNEIIGVFFQSRRATERESVHALSANSQPHPTDRQILSQRSTLNTSLPTDTT